MKRSKANFRAAFAALLIASAIVIAALPTPTLAASRTENAPAPLAPAWFGNTCIHVVAAGDDLFSLSLRFNTSMSELMVANRITNPNLIFIGMPMRVPCVAVSSSFFFFPSPVFVPTRVFVPFPFFVPFSFNSMFNFSAMFR